MTWTPETVKAILPPIKVAIQGKIIEGRLSGRKNQFATILVRLKPQQTVRQNFTQGDWFTCEIAWTTAAHCLNTGNPVQW